MHLAIESNKMFKAPGKLCEKQTSVVAAVMLFSPQIGLLGDTQTFLSGSNEEITLIDLSPRFPKTFFSSFPSL